ncbi:MAG: protoheme farnesyltransferase [Planctomycetaceae bacterium]|nr:protoheme farnesyltransferase [Planctomycetaceae bacterium]
MSLVTTSTATAPLNVEPRVVAATETSTFVLHRLCDYLELTKPKIAVLALITVSLGFALSAAESGLHANWWVLLGHANLGIALVAASSSAWNQLLERRIDSLMVRTRNRPLPAGRLSTWEVTVFAVVTAIGGIAWLAMYVNALTAGLAGLTLVLYSFVYTPLKRFTTFNTVVGAIPGALPPVLGWTAAGGNLDGGAFALFAVLFLWQFPHFMAIAWLYRDDYRNAGLKMIPVVDSTGLKTGLTAVGYSLALLPVSWLPAQLGLAGNGYAGAATILGIWYILASVQFLRLQTVFSAKRLLWTSLLYLPALLGALVWDRYQLLS